MALGYSAGKKRKFMLRKKCEPIEKKRTKLGVKTDRMHLVYLLIFGGNNIEERK